MLTNALTGPDKFDTMRPATTRRLNGMHRSRMILFAAAALAVLTAFAVATVRTDIDVSGFPSSWDVSGREGYSVDVRCASFEALETSPFSAVAKTFDIDTTSSRFLLTIR